MNFITTALVLNSYTLAEKDVRLYMLSPEKGIFEAVAKGGRKSKKRFVNLLEPFSLLRVHLRKGRISYLPPFLDQADLLEPFENLRSSFVNYLRASYVCELVECLFRPFSGQEAFRPLLQVLYLLNASPPPWALLKLHFELQMLHLSGFAPKLKECSRCGKKPSGKRRYFSTRDGGVICEGCFREGDLFLSPAVQAFLQHLTRLGFEKLSRLRPAAENLKEAEKIIEEFVLFVVDREIGSLRILKEML